MEFSHNYTLFTKIKISFSWSLYYYCCVFNYDNNLNTSGQFLRSDPKLTRMSSVLFRPLWQDRGTLYSGFPVNLERVSCATSAQWFPGGHRAPFRVSLFSKFLFLVLPDTGYPEELEVAYANFFSNIHK